MFGSRVGFFADGVSNGAISANHMYASLLAFRDNITSHHITVDA